MDTFRHLEKQNQKQSLPFIIAVSLFSAVVFVSVWTFFVIAVGYMANFFAILVGIVVSYVVKSVSKSKEKIYGIISAVVTLLACVVGLFLSQVAGLWQIANEVNPDLSYFDMINLVLSDTQLTIATVFSRISILVYGYNIFTGYILVVEKKQHKNPLQETEQGQKEKQIERLEQRTEERKRIPEEKRDFAFKSRFKKKF